MEKGLNGSGFTGKGSRRVPQNNRTEQTVAAIETLCDFREICRRFADEAALKVILWEREGTVDLKDVLRRMPRSRTVVGIVGPEGGFDHP